MPTSVVNFTVGDPETAAVNLAVTGLSSDQVLLPNANIVLGGSGSTRSVTLTPGLGQIGTATVTLTVSDGDGGSAISAFQLNVTANVGPQSVSNVVAITIPSMGNASSYPSTLAVSSLSGNITKVTVTLLTVSHTWPDDINVLLVGPTGQKALLMANVGGSADAVNLNLTFDDTAGTSLPDETILSGGTFKPTVYGTVATFVSPAPAGPYGTSLAAFVGTNPNGTWSLYVVDDSVIDGGSITGGWSLTFDPLSAPPPPQSAALNGGGLASTPSGNQATSCLEAPPSFLSVTPLPLGQVRLVIQGGAGNAFSVEESTDLRTWNERFRGRFEQSSLELLDEVQGQHVAKFYRVKCRP